MENEINPDLQARMTLKVTDLARGGAGVAKDSEGRVIFIPFAAPGDTVRVQIVENHKTYAHAELLQVLEPSPIRVDPPCPVFGKCGGCHWQHLPYSVQWDTKGKGVLQALGRVGFKEPLRSSIEFIPAQEIWNYRNRIQLRGEGGQLGFYQSNSRRLVPTDQCWIAKTEMNQVWEEVRSEGKLLDRPYKVEVEVLRDGQVRKVWNARHSAGGFRQVHDAQNEKLKHWVISALPETEILYDLFGGSGNLSLQMADRCREVHCVDLSTPQVRPPDVPQHFYFHRSAVDRWLKHRVSQGGSVSSSFRPDSGRSDLLAHSGERWNSAILDPPRAGLKSQFAQVASSLEALGVRNVVAIGCDPDAWARDLRLWTQRGWNLQRVMVIDLFPQTFHVESVALLQWGF